MPECTVHTERILEIMANAYQSLKYVCISQLPHTYSSFFHIICISLAIKHGADCIYSLGQKTGYNQEGALEYLHVRVGYLPRFI